MVKGRLIMALDFARRKGDTDHKIETYKKGGQWYICKTGPTYSNSYEVTEFDEEGLNWLESHEQN